MGTEAATKSDANNFHAIKELIHRRRKSSTMFSSQILKEKRMAACFWQGEHGGNLRSYHLRWLYNQWRIHESG